ncbi:DUF481 domain-containing protein [Aestuariibacter sp. GS-14]|uniref:DUF481 domain-containing protein n=1 Tax=Alteromonadaceae TaxID=72275 RepID=UPI00112AF023|nr:DUF481 domain-containing protein [Aestuariibacter sp. GS-14]TPV62185.1 DUF481 domain-containing protein [Aestuariibacter sp. GS-14]
MVHRIILSALISLICSSFCANAADKDLIRTLYHADFVEYDEEPKDRFTLDGQLGIIFSSGNTNATSIKSSLKSEHENDMFANQYWVEFLYKQSEVDSDEGTLKQTTAQRLYTYVQSDYKLRVENQRLFVYGDYEDDRFNGYDHRSSIAGGWSQQVWRNEISDFRFSVGPGYSFAKLDSGEKAKNIHGFIVRASAEYHYIWPTGAKLRQFVSTEAGEDNIKSRTETSLSANLFESLALKLSFIMQHNTNPTSDNMSLNTETSVAVVYRFF